MMTSAAIRKAFLDFFRSKHHHIVPSASIVIKNDPTLLFTNAGMNQFKDYFLANKPAPWPRVADTQKCLRVSGKHNDLEEVGVDTYHHTMFEMLGNWSFGDYFKKEAIAFSWELLTKVYGIPQDRLYVTVFEGDQQDNLPEDTEALAEWQQWIAADRIIGAGKKENFWEMGDTGPCGPCTEIHVDCRPDAERSLLDGKALVNRDHPQVIEIWNNVFIQFNRLKNGGLEQLPARHVDTGMGFERLTRVLQQKQSNYDTDIFSGTIGATETLTGKSYGASNTKQDVAFRVIADHLRAIAFTIADGQLPSNTGAGYVIRRVLRRAVRYYYSYLNYRQPMLFALMPVLAEQFSDIFPELLAQLDFVAKVVKEEEEAFLRTLEKGLKRIEEIVATATRPASDEGKKEMIFEGKAAFELNDTYGFPLDLTRLIVGENGYTVDEAAFEHEMQQQKNRSRAAGATDTEDWIVIDEDASTEFRGYDSLEVKTTLQKYRKVKAKGKEGFQLVLHKTPFYAESGGQAGDTGTLVFDNEAITITATKKENDLIIHFADRLPIHLSGELLAKVDAGKRKSIAIHHSATHLLHAALRQVLGKHVSQKGSLVNEEQLRFDFAHFAKVTPEEIAETEALVNKKIRENIPVVIRQMPKEEAISLGAMALFGEKYGDRVRVVTIDPGYSIELCGGTHVGATGELGFFKIKHETAIAAGVRRIEAVSGLAAEAYVGEQLHQLHQVKEQLKHPGDLLKAIENLALENTQLKKRAEMQEARQLEALRKMLLNKLQQVNGVSFLGEIVEVGSAEGLKKLCIDVKSGLSNVVVVLAAAIDGKASVALGIDEALSEARSLEAPIIIKKFIAPLIKGGGGGQKTLATAGGQQTTHLLEVIDAVRNLL